MDKTWHMKYRINQGAGEVSFMEHQYRIDVERQKRYVKRLSLLWGVPLTLGGFAIHYYGILNDEYLSNGYIGVYIVYGVLVTFLYLALQLGDSVYGVLGVSLDTGYLKGGTTITLDNDTLLFFDGVAYAKPLKLDSIKRVKIQLSHTHSRLKLVSRSNPLMRGVLHIEPLDNVEALVNALLRNGVSVSVK